MNEHRDFGSAAESSTRLPCAGRNLVAVIGIDAYQHWNGLHNAVSDARGVCDAFERLGFEVAGALLDRDATRAAMETLLDDLEDTILSDDRLVVFFAGHGWAKPHHVGNAHGQTGFLIPVDGSEDKHRTSTWIDLDTFLRRLSKLSALHVLVILDACYAGQALSHVFDRGRGSAALHTPFDTLHKRMSRMVIASTLDDETARDSGLVADHSLFTGFLLEALDSGRPATDLGDGRSVIHGSDLGRYVRDRVQRYDGDLGVRQTPDFGGFSALHKRGEMPIPMPPRFADGSKPHMPALEVLHAVGSAVSESIIQSVVEQSPPLLRAPADVRATQAMGCMVAVGGGVSLLAIAGFALYLSRQPPPALVTQLDVPETPFVGQFYTVHHEPPLPPPIVRPTRWTLPVVRTAAPQDLKASSPDVVANASKRTSYVVKPDDCFVDVRAFPAGAEVVRDGNVIGKTHTGLKLVLPCKTQVTLTFRKQDWTTVVKTATATAQGTIVTAGLKKLK